MVWAGSAMTGSGLPAPKGPARAIVATMSSLAAAAVAPPPAPSASPPPAASDRARERILEIGAERTQRILPQRDAGCHGVAAAFDDETRAHGLAHGAAEVDAGDRTPGAGADAARLERDGEGGPSELLLQPRGD